MKRNWKDNRVIDRSNGEAEDPCSGIVETECNWPQRLRDESARLLYDSVVYGAVRYLAVFSGAVLTPIYTRLLTKEDYGLIEIFVTWNMFAAMVLPLGLPTALQRFYPDVADDAERRRETIRTLHGMALVAVIVYSLLLLPFCGLFLGMFNATSAPKEVFYLSIV